MLSKNTNAKIIAVSEEKAQSLGIYNKDLRGVLIDGIPVDVNIVNENSARWNLPNIIVKADAYTHFLELGRGSEKFINVFSNREKNFQRWSARNVVHEWAVEKTDATLSSIGYGYQEAVNQIVFQKTFKDDRKWTDDEVNNILKEVQENELLTAKSNTLSRSQALDLRTEIISNYQVLLILLYNGFLSLKNDGLPETNDLMKRIRSIVNRVHLNLEHLGYDFDDHNFHGKDKSLDEMSKEETSKIEISKNDSVSDVTNDVVTPEEIENRAVFPFAFDKMSGIQEMWRSGHAPREWFKFVPDPSFSFSPIEEENVPSFFEFDEPSPNQNLPVVGQEVHRDGDFSFGEIQPSNAHDYFSFQEKPGFDLLVTNPLVTPEFFGGDFQPSQSDFFGQSAVETLLDKIEVIPEVEDAKMEWTNFERVDFTFGSVTVPVYIQNVVFFFSDAGEKQEKVRRVIQKLEENYYRYAKNGLIEWVEKQKQMLDNREGDQ